MYNFAHLALASIPDVDQEFGASTWIASQAKPGGRMMNSE